ncbi:MAG: glycoside hydrolase family 43 protein [Acidimicrobiales bacterium]
MGYRNPVIPGFHPDPSVCRVGDEYMLVASTFTWFAGVPIFRSRNLVDWEQVGNVLDRPSQLDLEPTTSSASLGVYAPTIRHHDGRFWMITTSVTEAGLTNFFVTAEDPAGPWSEPVTVEVMGIDPDLAWDGDGNCWLHFSTGMGAIQRCRIDDTTGEVLDGPEPTWSGTGMRYPEAPHLYQRDGTWYLLIAEGGTERGHAVSIARGPSPAGPWEGCPANPILSHRSIESPIQNTGHGDLVEASDGSWWMVLLGVRPRGASPGFHVLGRETFLTSVEWIDGWPVVAPVEMEVDRRPPGPVEPVEVGRDDFDEPTLHPRWIGVRRLPGAVASLADRPGWLTIHGGDDTPDDPFPALVGRRQQHLEGRARTLLDAGTSLEAGVAVYLDDTAHYEVAVRGDRIVAGARAGPFQEIVGEAAAPGGPVVLRIETAPHARGPDSVRLGFEEEDGTFRVLAEIDGRYLSTEVTGGFIGRVLGLYAFGGDAAFDWFDHEAIE